MRLGGIAGARRRSGAAIGGEAGGNLVANGSFDSDVSGWIQEQGSSLAWNAGRLRSTESGVYDVVKTFVPTANGTGYRLTMEFPAVTSGYVKLQVGIAFDDERYGAFAITSFPRAITCDFTTTSTSATVLRMQMLDGVTGNFFELDDVSVVAV